MVTDLSGNDIEELGTFPYGESWYNASNDKLMFTTYERDAESGNDYAEARYYVSRLGRFSAVDPVSGSISNPQSLNGYAYVLDDPINLVDPTGDFSVSVDCYDGDAGCPPESGGGGWGGPDGDSGGGSPPDLGGDPGLPGGNAGGGGAAGGCPGCIKVNIPPPPEPPGYEDCISGALEEVIAAAEGTDGQNGYGLVVYGDVLNGPHLNETHGPKNPLIIDPSTLTTGHPGIDVDAHTGAVTSAFGRCQITWTTAQTLGRGGTPWLDFTQSGQDDACVVLEKGVDMVQWGMKGNIQQAMWNANTTWTSLPDGSEERLTLPQAQQIFNQAMTYLPECQ